MNDSSTGGFLSPVAGGPAPLEDQALDRFLQQLVVGITGLPGTLVWPRWQSEPPNIPDYGTNWVAIGVTDNDPDTFAVELHSPAGNGSDTIYRNEVLEVLASFYGPNAGSYASLFREGIAVAQNREVLQLNAFGLVAVGKQRKVPELVKGRWLKRIDLPVTLRRAIEYVYPVLNLESADITVQTDQPSSDPYTVPITVSQEPLSPKPRARRVRAFFIGKPQWPILCRSADRSRSASR